MQPKLLALSGPLGKSEYRLVAPLSIGRNSSNSICVEDSAVSPVHCRIASQNDQVLLTDLDSASGTFVNGIPVKERLLTPGDQIAIGSSLFLFQIEESAPSPSNAVQFDETSSASGLEQQLRHDELVYAQFARSNHSSGNS